MADLISYRTLWITQFGFICLRLMILHLASQMLRIVEKRIRLIAGLLNFLSGGNNIFVKEGTLKTGFKVSTTYCQTAMDIETCAG